MVTNARNLIDTVVEGADPRDVLLEVSARNAANKIISGLEKLNLERRKVQKFLLNLYRDVQSGVESKADFMGKVHRQLTQAILPLGIAGLFSPVAIVATISVAGAAAILHTVGMAFGIDLRRRG